MTTNEVITVVETESGKFVTLDTELKDLGMDSLEFLNLMVQLGIPDASIPYINTVRDLTRVAVLGRELLSSESMTIYGDFLPEPIVMAMEEQMFRDPTVPRVLLFTWRDAPATDCNVVRIDNENKSIWLESRDHIPD